MSNQDSRSSFTESLPIRVALVDDQLLVRAGFRMVINSQRDMVVECEAANGDQALEEISRCTVDVVLMDIQMPIMDGIEATRQICSAKNSPKILVLTTFDSDEYLLSALGAGASGFLLKDAQPEELLAGIRTVYSGEAVISAKSTRRLLSHIGPLLASSTEEKSRPELPIELTPRETQTLSAMARGLTNSEIAQEFYVSEATVKTHVSRVLLKTGSRDRVQAVLFAFQVGLVTPEDLLRGT
ncbi:MAG: response regulator [Mycobacteriaceae bacterium]